MSPNSGRWRRYTGRHRTDMLQDFRTYVDLLQGHWLAFMSAGPFLIDRLVTWLWPWGRRQLDNLPHRRQLFLWLIIAGVFWSGFASWREQQHRAVLLADERNSAITERDAAKAEASDKQRKIDQLEGRIAVLEAARPLTAPARDPDGLYQLGAMVGSVGPTRIDLARGIVEFSGVRSAGKLNPNADIEYRDLVLRCEGLPTPPIAGFMGTVSSVSTGARCVIVRER